MSPSLRIAVDARPLAFPNSGIGRYTSRMLAEFSSLDIDARIFLYCDRPLTLPFELPAHWKLRVGKVSGRALSTPFAQAAFPLWAVADRVRVFWSPRHHLPLLLPPFIRKVVTVHDLVWKRFPETMTGGGKLIESILMPASLRCADRIIAVSQFTRQEIAACFPDVAPKIDVIYEASSLQDVSASSNRAAPNRRYFLSVGSSEPRKNLARLLEAYRLYRINAFNPPDLVLAGSYQWGEFDALDYINRHDLARCVRILRDIDDQTLSQLYANASALVMPSLYEGFGLPLVEAMQFGVPIITSDRGAMPEIAGNAALTVDPLDTPALSRAFSELAENTALQRQLSEHSRHRGTLFQWQPAATRTLEVLATR